MPAPSSGKESEVASIQRKVIDLLLADNLTDGGFFGLQRRGRGVDFNSFSQAAEFQFNVDLQNLRNLHGVEILLSGLRKALCRETDSNARF